MGKGKINEKQMEVLRAAIIHPISTWDINKSTLKALVSRDMLAQLPKEQAYHYTALYGLTSAAMTLLGVTPELVAVNYAKFMLDRLGGIGSHIGLSLVKGIGVSVSQWKLEKPRHYYTQEEREEAFLAYQQRAIELARAEWRAGIAKAEIGLVG